MTFQFNSNEVRFYFQESRHEALSPSAPAFAMHALYELSNQVHTLDFQMDSAGRYVGSLRRSYSDICGLVDWAGAIYRKCFDSELTTADLVGNRSFDHEPSPMEDLFGVIESWHDFPAENATPYLSKARYPHPHPSEIRMATIGNVCAALGLAVLDRLLVELPNLPTATALTELGVAWQCAALASYRNQHSIWTHCYEVRPVARTLPGPKQA